MTHPHIEHGTLECFFYENLKRIMSRRNSGKGEVTREVRTDRWLLTFRMGLERRKFKLRFKSRMARGRMGGQARVCPAEIEMKNIIDHRSWKRS